MEPDWAIASPHAPVVEWSATLCAAAVISMSASPSALLPTCNLELGTLNLEH
jgi:hypothetical protein